MDRDHALAIIREHAIILNAENLDQLKEKIPFLKSVVALLKSNDTEANPYLLNLDIDLLNKAISIMEKQEPHFVKIFFFNLSKDRERFAHYLSKIREDNQR